MSAATTIEKAGMLSGRQLVLCLVIGLHALVIGALMTMRITIDRLPVVTVFKPVTSVPEQPPLPPPPLPTVQPTIATPALHLPMLPVPSIATPNPITLPAEVPVNTVAESGLGPVTESVAIEVPATALQFRAIRSPDDYYPAASLRLQEQGDAIVRVCVSAAGTLEGPPAIERSSGSRHLDGAALKWASEALAFTPATRNGAAVSACKGFRVSFRLN